MGERANHVMRYTLGATAFSKMCGFHSTLVEQKQELLNFMTNHPSASHTEEWISCGPIELYYQSKMRVTTVVCKKGGVGGTCRSKEKRGGKESAEERAAHYFFEYDVEPINRMLPHYVRVDKAYMIHTYINSGGGVLYDEPEVYNAFCSKLYAQPKFKAHYDTPNYSCKIGHWANTAVRKRPYMLVIAVGVSLIVTLVVSIICCMGVQSLKKDFALAKKSAELDKTMYAATVHKQRLQARLHKRRVASRHPPQLVNAGDEREDT